MRTFLVLSFVVGFGIAKAEDQPATEPKAPAQLKTKEAKDEIDTLIAEIKALQEALTSKDTPEKEKAEIKSQMDQKVSRLRKLDPVAASKVLLVPAPRELIFVPGASFPLPQIRYNSALVNGAYWITVGAEPVPGVFFKSPGSGGAWLALGETRGIGFQVGSYPNLAVAPLWLPNGQPGAASEYFFPLPGEAGYSITWQGAFSSKEEMEKAKKKKQPKPVRLADLKKMKKSLENLAKQHGWDTDDFPALDQINEEIKLLEEQIEADKKKAEAKKKGAESK